MIALARRTHCPQDWPFQPKTKIIDASGQNRLYSLFLKLPFGERCKREGKDLWTFLIVSGQSRQTENESFNRRKILQWTLQRKLFGELRLAWD